jgi:ectoine hydroxylase-related dioxygenase (phytanoyl-CoA dioxygenase family)
MSIPQRASVMHDGAMSKRRASSTYEDEGYVVVPDVLGPEGLASAITEATAICRGLRGDIEGAVPADERDDDEAVLGRYLCIHFPHKVSALMRDLACHPTVVDALVDVIGPNVKLMQSMLFIKAAGKPGQAWHQDESHIPTRDRSLTAVWMALDDATVDNGCLWVIPGSHRRGVLYQTRDRPDARFDGTPEAHGFPHAADEATPVELPAGAALVFDGYLLHRSLPNRTTRPRRALVNHYMSAESLLPWFPPRAGEPMATLDHRDILLVAGEDPYAAKGTVDVVRPRLRPEPCTTRVDSAGCSDFATSRPRDASDPRNRPSLTPSGAPPARSRA